jgi:hypothetical protein
MKLFRKKKKELVIEPAIIRRVVRMYKEVSLWQKGDSFYRDGNSILCDDTRWNVGVWRIMSNGSQFEESGNSLYRNLKTLEEADKCFKRLVDQNGVSIIKTLEKEAEILLKK